MSTFDYQIQALNDKLLQMQPRQNRNIPHADQICLEIEDLQQYSQTKAIEIMGRYDDLMLTLQTYQSERSRILSPNDRHMESICDNFEVEVESLRREESENGDRLQKQYKDICCQVEEDVNNEKCQFELRVREIKKQIERQVTLLQKEVQALNSHSTDSFVDPDKKVYRQYYAKLVKIEENEKKKVQRISQMESKVQRRIDRLNKDISDKISGRQKQTKGKYEKLKRLFSLITDIS